MTTSEAKSPDASDSGKTTKIGVLAPMSIILFIALTLAGTYYVRKMILQRAMEDALTLEDGPTIRSLLRTWPAPVNVRGRVIDPSEYVPVRVADTPLLWAAGNRDVESIRICVRHGADLNARGTGGETALHRVAYDDLAEAARLLIEGGADLNVRTDEETSDRLSSGDDVMLPAGRRTPLLIAVRHDREASIAEMLIAAGADVNLGDDDGATALHFAVMEGRDDLVKLLLARGANVRARGFGGTTPLHFARTRGAVEMLVAARADPNACADRGETPLHWVVERGHEEASKCLLQKGADVKAKDSDGRTPLHVAAWEGKKGVAEFLVSKGADVNAKDGRGKTALQSAIDEKRDAIAKMLRNAGAKE